MALGLSDWKDEIRKAKLYQNKGDRLNRWKDYRKWYRNEYPDSIVSVNKVFGIGRAMVPQLYFKAPTILVRARKEQYTATAKILEKVDTWLIDHIGFKSQVKYMILDAYIVNIGVGKVGYHSISTEIPNPSPEGNEAVAEMLGTTPDELNEEMVRRKWSYHDYIKPDCPWYLRMRPQDLLVPWGFVDEHEAPWAAIRITRPLIDVKADPVYRSTRKLEANVKIDSTAGAESSVASPNALGAVPSRGEFVELFEIWDKRDGTIRVLSLDHDSWLREEEHELDITGLPMTILRFNPDGEDFWGVSDVEQIRKQVHELNENRTHEIESKRISNVKVAVDTNVIPEDEIIKLEKGKPGPVVRGTGNVQAALAQFHTDTPPDLYRVDDIIDKDIRDTIGFSRNQSGEFEGSRRTATETKVVQQSHELRADERRDLVADLISETFRDKIHPLIFQFWTEERTIEVTEVGGWVTYTGKEIRGDYNVTTTPDSVLPVSRAMEQQLSLQLFQMFNNDPMVKQRELRIAVLQAYKDVVANPEILLETPEDLQKKQQAMQQQQQQAQLHALPGGKK